MELVDTWAVKIAEQAAPKEVDHAPSVARDFLKGGKAREALFPARTRSSSIFGPDTVMAGTVMLPHILAAIQQAGAELPQLLALMGGGMEAASTEMVSGTADTLSGTTGVISNATGAGYYVAAAISVILNIRGRKERDEKKEELIEDERTKRVLADLEKGIKEIPNINEDQADLITYRMFKTMLEAPSDAARFTKKIEEAPRKGH